jgi:hypothetical protein
MGTGPVVLEPRGKMVLLDHDCLISEILFFAVVRQVLSE